MPTTRKKTTTSAPPADVTSAGKEGPRNITFAEPAELEILAIEAAADGESKLPRFRMTAHNFNPVRVAGWFNPMVVEAKGMKIPSQTRPIRYAHDPNQGVGHTDMISIVGGKLIAEGVISRDTPAARDVVGSSKMGFPWQASIGASVDEYEYIAEKQQATVNDRVVTGPLIIARKTTLNEISFVDLGADDKTRAKVAAVKAPGADDDGPEDDEADSGAMASIRRKKAEVKRQGEIKTLVEGVLEEPGAPIDEIAAIAEKALDENWSFKDAKIAILELRRPRAPAPRRADLPTQPVLEAALCLGLGIADKRLAEDRDYGPEVVNRAWPLRHLGLHGTMSAALEAAGLRVPHGKNALFEAVREHSRGGPIQAGMFSTVNLPGLLGNVANKVLIDAFTMVDAIYPIIADQADFSNFHTHSIFRLGFNGDYEEIGSGGELKHASLDEDTYSNRVATRGMVLALTRQQMINDDMNSFRSLTAQMGRKARIAAEKAIANVVMESVDSFYTAARGNRLTSNPLSITGLSLAEAALVQMADSSGDPIYAMGRYLLVPSALRYLADQIFVSTTLDSGDAVQRPDNNPFRGRFQVVTSPFLSSPVLDGSSPTTWYLVADPMMVPAYQMAYLDGRRQPTIESGDAHFDTLGMMWRTYWDFGTSQIDFRGSVKSTP